MDGSRFDDLARSLAGGGSRRGFVAGLLGLGAAVLGGAARGAPAAAQAGCRNYGQGCAAGEACCGGAACQGGVCRCPAGAAVSNTINGLRGLPARAGPRGRLPLPVQDDRAAAGRRGLSLSQGPDGHGGRIGLPVLPIGRRVRGRRSLHGHHLPP